MVDRKTEHEGGEFEELEGIVFENRDVFDKKKAVDDDKKLREDNLARQRAQEEWLSTKNPLIWDGDDD